MNEDRFRSIDGFKQQELWYGYGTFMNYRNRLYIALVDKGVTCAQVATNTQLKDTISNYVQKEVVDKETSLKLAMCSAKLSHMEIDTSDGVVTYPIINFYKGHYLTHTILFTLNDDEINIQTIEVVPKKIILS